MKLQSLPSIEFLNFDFPKINRFDTKFFYLKFDKREEFEDQRGNGKMYNDLNWMKRNGGKFSNFDPVINTRIDKSNFIDTLVRTGNFNKTSRFINTNNEISFRPNSNIVSILNQNLKIGSTSNLIFNSGNDINNYLSEVESDIEIDSKFIYSIEEGEIQQITEIIGYYILKEEFSLSDNKITFIEEIIINDSFKSNYKDYNIIYNKGYRYTIIPIIRLYLSMHDFDIISTKKIYLLSNKSKLSSVVSIDTMPPESPNDFNQFYDERNEKLILNWSLSSNVTEDIKKIKIYRRENINENFELLVMQDFNDNLSGDIFVHNIPDEFIDKQYIEVFNAEFKLEDKISNPTYVYFDEEFDKNKKYIYSISSVDAHGFESNYSAQIEVSFDYKNNKINRKLISRKGAPLEFPNLLIEDIEELPRTFNVLSKYKKMEILFNPDNYVLMRQTTQQTNSQPENIINIFQNRVETSEQQEIFGINLINIDNKKQKSINIFIDEVK